ncbi:flavodoxin family protein [Chloroflexota bacterium]
MMKVLGIACSPRKKGNTDILLEQALKGAREDGAEVEFLPVRELDIKPCQGCSKCSKDGRCRIKDDMHIVYDKMVAADGIIFSVPIYFWSMYGQAKVLMDRTFALRYPSLKLTNKVGGLIMAGTRHGFAASALPFWFFFISNQMLPTEIVSGFATQKGGVRKDIYAMKASLELGKWVGKLIESRFKFPDVLEGQTFYNYVRSKHGLYLSPTETDEDFNI